MSDLKAIDPRDPWLVINDDTGKPVESHPTQQRAIHAAGILNDHELRHGRAPRYRVQNVQTDAGN